MTEATSLDIKVTLAPHPITNQLSYKINTEFANPSLTVYKGFLYRIQVQTNSTHPFVIKQASGDLNFGQYNNGVTGNNSFNNTIEWLVQEDTPNYLIYQSPNNKTMMGLITVKSPNEYLLNSMRLIDETNLGETSLSDLVSKFNHNCSIALTTNDALAGRGLTFKNKKLEIDSYGNSRFFLDNSGKLIFADTKVLLRDNLNSVSSYPNPDELLDALNTIATSIRQLKDPQKPFYSPINYTLEEVSDLATEVDSYVQNIESTLIDLQRKYEELLNEYEELKEYFTEHTHDASDIKTGILSPNLLGRGVPNVRSYLRGDGTWSTIS